jgi:hypothetical protein
VSDQVFSVLFPGRSQFGVLVPDGGGGHRKACPAKSPPTGKCAPNG